MAVLQDITDRITSIIIRSTITHAKTVSEISGENHLPLSSTYKRIRDLNTKGIIHIEKISIDKRGKKMTYYKCKMKSLEVKLNEHGLSLHLGKIDV